MHVSVVNKETAFNGYRLKFGTYPFVIKVIEVSGVSLSALTDTKKTLNLLVGKPDSETVNFPIRSVPKVISVLGTTGVLPSNNSKVKASSPLSGKY